GLDASRLPLLGSTARSFKANRRSRKVIRCAPAHAHMPSSRVYLDRCTVSRSLPTRVKQAGSMPSSSLRLRSSHGAQHRSPKYGFAWVMYAQRRVVRRQIFGMHMFARSPWRRREQPSAALRFLHSRISILRKEMVQEQSFGSNVWSWTNPETSRFAVRRPDF